MGNVTWTAPIGLVDGAVAKRVRPGTQGGAITVTLLLGVVGSLVATFGGQAPGLYPPGAGAGFIASVIGAILVLWLYGKFFRKGA